MLACDTSCANKHLAMDMELIQDMLQFSKIICSDSIAPHNVAEVQESSQALDHFRRDMASNCSKVDLVIWNEYVA
jgi:hypothetical protein